MYKAIIKLQVEYYQLTETGEYGQIVDEQKLVRAMGPNDLEDLKADVEYHFLEGIKKLCEKC